MGDVTADMVWRCPVCSTFIVIEGEVIADSGSRYAVRLMTFLMDGHVEKHVGELMEEMEAIL